MKIIQIGWLSGKPVPPNNYGGIERMTATLCRELIRQGHEVVLIAPIGSYIEGATVIETSDFGKAYELVQSIDADVVHSHECWALDSVVRKPLNKPFIATTHVMHAIGFSKNVVYLSYSQRNGHSQQLNKHLSDSPVIYVPIDPQLARRRRSGKKSTENPYLLYLGLVAEHKGVHDAARVAAELKIPLKVAGPAWGAYADRIKAMPYVELVGEVDGKEKLDLIYNATAVMCLHNNHNGWLEPGCGVVGEANALNTPVAAFPNGSLYEQVVTAQNGWLGKDVAEIISLMDTVPVKNSKKYALEHWAADIIVKQYVDLYTQVIEGHSWQ